MLLVEFIFLVKGVPDGVGKPIPLLLLLGEHLVPACRVLQRLDGILDPPIDLLGERPDFHMRDVLRKRAQEHEFAVDGLTCSRWQSVATPFALPP